MSLQLRIILIVGAFVSSVFVMRKIQKAQMKIKDSIIWIFMSIFILVLSLFPEIAMKAAGMSGVESPVNLVYLCIIFILITMIFSLSVKVSRLEYKLSVLAEEIAIREKEYEEK